VDDERAIEAITREAREARPRPSRALWLVAGIVGLVCAIAFIVFMNADATTPTVQPAQPTDRGHGFTAGLVLGGVAGIAIGFVIARQRHSSRSTP